MVWPSRGRVKLLLQMGHTVEECSRMRGSTHRPQLGKIGCVQAAYREFHVELPIEGPTRNSEKDREAGPLKDAHPPVLWEASFATAKRGK